MDFSNYTLDKFLEATLSLVPEEKEALRKAFPKLQPEVQRQIIDAFKHELSQREMVILKVGTKLLEDLKNMSQEESNKKLKNILREHERREKEEAKDIQLNF